MKMLGIDYGDRYVGFAECDDMEIIAYPLESVRIKSMKEAISVSESIVIRDNIRKIIIGLPLMPDGAEGIRASKTRTFGRVLEKVTNVPIIYYDERLTTVQAEEYLSEGGIKKKDMKKYTDKLSAQIILNDYMNAKSLRKE
ncbi:MAG: Holliday junction resolvase RuvX [Clostridia bacterium]|nr:Holliday junction resolvase RuvX [Clostridia bacterium]